jgi:predicted TIM-barrel fold metal-dependent hydrolase
MTQALANPPAADATPRKLTLIDADIHHAPDNAAILKRMPKALQKRSGGSVGMPGIGSPIGVNRSDASPPGGGQPGSDPDYLLEHHFEPLGIDYGLLHPGNTLGWCLSGDYRWAAAACTAYNDYMLETWLDHGPARGRFLGAMVVSHSWPEAAAKEIRRVGGDPRFKEIYTASATNIPLGNVRYWPIYEAAEEMGLPLAVHPGTEGRGVSNPPSAAGYPSSYFEWHNILPTNYMAQINSLVCEGVFQQFPGMKFVAVEGGVAWLPHLMWRMDKNWKALRELTPWLEEPPSEVIRKHVRLTSQPVEEPNDPQQLLQVFEMMHARETLMFSSDYPHWDNDDPRHAFPGQLDGELKDRIFWGNAAELFDLS